jgi:hypothetical protein
MINNPAKAVYAKFDMMARLMKMDNTTVSKKITSKGLLNRIGKKDFIEKDSKQQEPLEMAMDYFVAIRQAREAIERE